MKKKKFTVDKMTFVAFTIIPLILYTFFYFISVSCGIYYSLTDWNGLNREYNFVGIANYIALSKNVFMWRSLWRTLLYACMLVVCVTVLSLIIALVLNSVKKCRVFVKSVFFFPAMLGSVAVALIWDQMFYQLLPAVGKMMGVNLQTPLADPSTAIFGVLFVNVWQAVAILTNIVLDGEQLIVYNKSGIPVYSCSGKNVEKQEDSQGKIWKCLNIAEMEEDSAVKTFAIGKDTYIGGIQKLNQLGWTVVTYTDRSYVRKPYTQNIRVFFIIAVLITVFDLGLAYLFIRRLNFSIHGLCQAMEKSGENGIPETLFLEKREFKTEIDMLIHSYNNVICRLKKSMEQSEELQMNEQRMEFRMLQAQINPHFLYNTFNLISSIAGMNGIDSICKITVSISEMFRYSIQENLIVQLQDELREINNYVTIQTIRFKDRLYADFDVEEEVLKVPIPIFLLQPLVENAIIHGLEPKAESGYINIVAYMEDDFVEILIRDNGVGIPQDKLCQIIQSLEKEQIESISMQGHSSIGIKNVNQRIKAYYGAEYGLHLESRVNVGTTISIRLPKNLTKKYG